MRIIELNSKRLSRHIEARRVPWPDQKRYLFGWSALLPAASLMIFAPGLEAQITVNEPIPQVATIDIDATQSAGQPIPRTIFGTFLEPIGNSTYNGLWAELLQNASFEAGMWSADKEAAMLRDQPELRRASDLDVPLPWEPLDSRQGNRYEIHYGDAANSWQSLEIFGVPGEATGIKQRVYLPIHRTRDYQGSFYARHLSGASGVTIALRAGDHGETLASQSVEVTDTAWKKYSFTLHVSGDVLHRLDPADFVAQVEGDERVEVDEFSLMPSDAIDGLDPDAVAMAKQMHTPLVRFGGNFTSSYHWKDGIGPRDKRLSMLNNSWGIPEYNTFGTDEFLEFCRQIGAQPQIALNLGSGTPKEAAEWVQYVDDHWSKHSGLLWELGNELWGNWNLGYPTRDELAKRTLDFSRAVRAADPTARLIATGQDPEVFTSWNAIQLTNPPGTFDYLSTHFVVGIGAVQFERANPDFVAEAGFALPIELERRLRQAQEQIDHTPGYDGKVHIAFTEWLFVGDRQGGSAPNFLNMGGAVVTGGFLNMLMRNVGIVPISDMTGIMEFAGIWKKRSQVFGTPAYYVFKLYANADAARPVSVAAKSGSYSVAKGVRRLPDIANVPYLDVDAALSENGKTLTLFCVNRSLATDIPAEIHLHHFAPSGSAKVQLVGSTSIEDVNDEDEPTRVAPVETRETLRGDGWEHIFPHSSVTVISLREQ
ncbi:MAG TPA: alpha-L-arabinofuranosidase C-terminal domain-containing protein [Terracidiphilus sp.]|nr:alpha-L-arabinofuranosidase C-terminal domain-containing protein [Terracidiphilus sp.]